MTENLKVRWGIILVILTASLIYFMPNLINVGESWPFSKTKMIYGLDIQGGSHLVMGVDVDSVIIEKTARLAKGMQNELNEQGVSVESVAVSGDDKTKIIVNLKNPGDLSKLEDFLDDYYPATLQVLESDGSKVWLRYYETKIAEYKKQVLSQAIEVIRNRIDEFGVSEPSIVAQGDDRILVQLPGIQDSAQAKDLINRTARLEFYPVVEADKFPPEKLQSLISEAETVGNYALGKDDLSYGAYIKRLNEGLKDKIPQNTRVVFEKNASAVSLEAGKIPYLISTTADLGGEDLEDASVRYDQYGKPEVVFSFTVDGRRKFAEITEQNVGKRVAIVLDEIVQSAPVIQEKINSPTARITLNNRNYQESLKEAQFIATALRAGALPASLKQLEERTVGPTLGADSVKEGAQAAVLAAILVFGFMLIYYRFLGFAANLALAMNVLMIFAALTSLGATLTLPGIAGIALTMGMAVDANVIIFERIKEELQRGTGLKMAIKDGFSNAFSAIFDSNITTAATCVVLMYYGTGPVRGFAVTLIIGTITSMFTAIFVSRAVIDLFVNRFGFRKVL